MADNSPAFQYYPADLLSDPEVMFWDMEAIGCYWQLITYLWLNGGKFEFNLENLCKLFRVNRKKTAEKLWKKIEKKFVFQNGIVTHKRVIKEMQKQTESRLKRQEAGKKGAESRWGNDSNANSNAIEKNMAKHGSSTSTSTSTSVIKENNIKEKITFSFQSGGFENITSEDILAWSEAYPAVDVQLAIKQAAQWLISNPSKRKKNYRRFLTHWFARTQEKGGNKHGSNRTDFKTPQRNSHAGANGFR